MKQNLVDTYEIIEGAIDEAIIRQKFNLKMHDYLKSNKFTKDELDEILNSPSVETIKTTSVDVGEYIEGGSDNKHKQLREVYGHLSKPLARKIKIYFDSILEDIITYKNKKGKRSKKNK